MPTDPENTQDPIQIPFGDGTDVVSSSEGGFDVPSADVPPSRDPDMVFTLEETEAPLVVTPGELTPSLTDGVTPAETRLDATEEARAVLSRQNAAVNTNSPTLASNGETTTAGGVMVPGSQARRTQQSAQGIDDFPTFEYPGMLPHKFRERKHQVMHHDVIVYIQGVDVSEWLEGSVGITHHIGADPSTCDITLNNALDRFVLTKENFSGTWRVSADENDLHASDYSEAAKKAIFDIKWPLGNNPVDALSGGRCWPLNYDSPIFHKMDPVRVWVRNPNDGESDEYIPLFTGYAIHINYKRGYTNHESSITIQCKDIRELMRMMRTNTNSVLFVQPGENLTTNNSETDTGVATDNVGGGAFSPTFFEDLVVVNTLFSNPWANFTLFEMIQALTYGGGDRPWSPQTVINQSGERDREAIHNQIRAIEAQIQATASDSPNYPILQRQHAALVSRLEQTNARQAGGQPGNANESGAAPNSTPASGPTSNTQQQAAQNQSSSASNAPSGATLERQRPQGQSRIGRLSRGQIYKYPDARARNEAEENTDEGVDENAPGGALMATWNSLLTFGFPEREKPTARRGEVLVDNQGAWLKQTIVQNTDTCSYWTRDQVTRAGKLTRSNRAWAPDTQLVHILKPSRISTGDAVIQDNAYIDGSSVNTQRNWVSRLQLLCEGVDAADYRFWVSGTGDLIFEFPQYDFYPSDYNHPNNAFGWQEIYEFDHHLESEVFEPESGEIFNCVIATGGITGYSQFADAGSGGGAVSALAPEAYPHAIVYCPVLTARHGVNIKVIPLPLITNVHRLQQIAAMEFQRLLGLASTYQLTTNYRPWVLPNRPIFNRLHPRYGLSDTVTHSLSVRESAGSPQTSIGMQYPRSVDELGIPRFISGAPSLPVYYGKIPTADGSTIMDQLQRRADIYRAAIASENPALANVLPSDIALQNYAIEVRSYPPMGYEAYNVIPITSLRSDGVQSPEEGVLADQLYEQLSVLNNELTFVAQNRQLSQSERLRRVDEISESIARVNQQLTDLGEFPNQTAASSTPLFGRSGVRIPEVSPSPNPNALAPNEEDPLCDLDGLPFGSPLGTSTTGLYPREIITEFDVGRHPAVDYAAEENEPVYAVADGTVVAITDHPYFGKFMKVAHAHAVFSLYAPVVPDVAINAVVYRNQQIAKVSTSQEATEAQRSILHFALGQTEAQSAGPVPQGRFVPPQRFPIADVGLVRNLNFMRTSFYLNRSSQEGASPTRIHGGFDIMCPEGTEIVSATAGTISKVYKNTPHEGFGLRILDDSGGGYHYYFHMQELPLVRSGRVVAGQAIGKVGSTGRSTGNHLHYQVELKRAGKHRVDVSPRLAALALGLPCIDGISKYEATNIYEKESGRQRPIQAPANAPESPADPVTVADIQRRIGGSNSSVAANHGHPDATYFNPASAPDTQHGVPFKAPPAGLLSSDTITFAAIGDVEAVRGSNFLRAMTRTLGDLLHRTVTITGHGIAGSSILQWLEGSDVAQTRPARTRNANIDKVREVARSANVIFVSLGSNEPTLEGMTAASILSLNSELAASGAVVIWVKHKPFPTGKRLFNGRSIDQMINAGVAAEMADPHLRAGISITEAGVTAVDALSGDPMPDRGYLSDRTRYSNYGANIVASLISPLVVRILRAVSGSSTLSADPVMWARSVPPEDCPPGSQRRLHGQEVQAQDIEMAGVE